jgi:HEAT repeat protein
VRKLGVPLLACALLCAWSVLGLASADEAMARLKQGSPLEAEDAIQEVAALGSDALPQLLSALQDRSYWVRARVARVLALIRDQRAVEPLLKMLDELEVTSRPEDTFPQRYLRIEILRALGELGGEQAQRALEQAMSSADEYTATHAVIAACRLTGRTSDRLLALLRHPNGDLRNLAVNGIAAVGKPSQEDLAALVQALRDPEWYVRDSAVAALGQVGDKSVAKAVQELVTDPSPFVALTAKEALQRINTR